MSPSPVRKAIITAAGLGTLKAVEAPVIPGNYPCPVEILIDDPEGCPAFYGRVVRGVKPNHAPFGPLCDAKPMYRKRPDARKIQ